MIRCSAALQEWFEPSVVHPLGLSETPVTHILPKYAAEKRSNTKKVGWLDNHGNAVPLSGEPRGKMWLDREYLRY